MRRISSALLLICVSAVAPAFGAAPEPPVLAPANTNPPATGFADPKAHPGLNGALSFEDLLKIRDPFKIKQKREIVSVAASPLESHPVESFQLVGVITGPSRLRAVLKDPDGKSHIVGQGVKIGLRNGTISRIGEDRIVVIEKMTNILGQIEKVETELPLVREGKGPEVPGGFPNGAAPPRL